MHLFDLGERRILKEIIFKYLESPEFMDEDAALLSMGDGFLVVNVDTFVKSTDAPKGMRYGDMGWKSVIMAASDVIVKGAEPKAVLISLTVPMDLEVSIFESVISGIRDACDLIGSWYVGGDLGSGKELVISAVCLGLTERVIRRRDAKIGDSVWVTDLFGVSGLVLHYLLHGGEPLEGMMEKFLQEFFRPKIDAKYASALRHVATSSMDSSDGLAVTLNDISLASNVAIELYSIPISPHAVEYAEKNGLDPLELALYAGEEFIIVFTTDKSDDEVYRVFRNFGLKRPIKIGKVVRGHGVYFEGRRIPRKGWEHFART